MMRFVRWISRLSVVLPVAVVSLYSPSFHSVDQSALAAGGPITFKVEELDGSQFIYVVFHALDRDGFCSAPDGAVSLHPVLNMPIDFQIEAGDGVIIESSAALASFGRHADDVPTFSTGANAAAGSPILTFPPLVSGVTDECQAWVRVSQSIPGPLRVMVTAPSDDGAGSVAFIADLERPAPETGVTLNFRWSLVTWNGSDGVTPSAALKGPSGGSDITPQVSAIYGWDAVTQSWRAFFPSGAGVPGANDLASLKAGAAYWVAVNGPGNVTWVTS